MENNVPPLPPETPTRTSAPLPPPPLLRAAAPPRASKSGRGWMIVAVVLLCLLCFSVLSNVSHLLPSILGTSGGQSTAGPRLEETLLEAHQAQDKIAVIAVQGIIMGEALDRGVGLVDLVEAQLKKAADDKRVKAVILKVDSPGGEVLASDEINRLVLKFQQTSKKPVIASMGSMAASGGYYISAPCQWIVANQMTLTGSIGVIMSSLNYRGLMDKVGVRPEVFKSGHFKDMLRGSKATNEITQQERDMVQALVNDAFKQFKTVVEEGRAFSHEQNQKARQEKDRGQTLMSDWEQYADGRVLTGREAYQHGFVDELGNFHTAVDRALKLANLDKANVVQYKQVVDFSDLLRLFGKSEARSIKLDLGASLPALKSGQLYYLSSTFVY